ncbi:MAG: glucoamylase family protein, partial [Bacilli bacterium]|nr:glucoamylase family protein [Bacilli bacterium]
YLRCGLVNDVELFDDYPSAYLNDAIRHHRWNRGDWQISGWLKNKVTDTSGEVVSNPISILSKWKIFDNLRRSLTSLFLLLIIFYGFTIGIGEAFYYLLLVGIIIALPIIFYLFSKVIYRSKYDMFLKYYLNLVKGIFTVINKSYITLTVLPYEAYLYLDSIIKSLYRMFVSKKKLLNWITAEEIEKTLKNNLETYLKTFKINYICSVLLVVGCAIYKPNDIVIAAIIASVWFLAPIVMYFMSQKLVLDQKSLDKHETKDIINLATRTWQYFDDLIAEEYNYLIPDNYQLNREEKVDHKTSPTNIGFSLLSVISAYELGIISNDRAIKMITNIITSIERLEKWNGHLFNWYDIYSLEKMHPYFISTVDNGNLAASLYVVKGFLEKQDNREMLYRVSNLIEEMDFTKLYSNDLDVFSIGYDYGEQTLVPYNYNNFASEARLTSYIAIAKGDAPYKHWFCLDKALTKYKYYKGVASWSGTAFEYFMPLIFNKTFDHTLLDETYYYAYYTQREFIREINPKLPWGISESAYNELDDSENYKYESFGIPYLKLQDSPSYPIVISPYSSIMAISIDDQEVYNNINKFKDLNMYGKYGFYEAYDYEDNVIIKNYYAHHQGMILTSLTNYLKDNIIQEYFHSDKNIASVEMLLKEKVQIKTYIDLKISKYKKHLYSKETHPSDIREYNELKSVPEFGVLSNGFYSLIINDRGVGLSKYKNLQINRYRKIASEDYGIFLYIRNLNSNKLWSNTYAPLNAKPNSYKVTFASDRIKYVREDDGIVTTTEMTVVKDHNAELRKITFQNDTDRDVTLEITSFAEVIMCRNEEDIAHRAFNSLSINSEIDKDTSSLIFSRKSRTKDNTKYFVVNRMFLSHDNKEHFEYETSRAQFIGRNRDVTNPKIIMEKQKLSKTIGASLDPIMSIRKRITIKAKGKSKLYLLVGFGKSKEQVMEIVGSYSDDFSVDKAFDMSTVLNNIRTSYNNLTPHQMHLYNAMLKYIFYALPMTDKRKKILEENQLSQQALWKFKVSGDWPIILVNIDKIEDVGFIKDVLQVYEFYKVRAIYIDIVIINNEKKTKAEIISNYLNNIIYHINSLNYFENTPGSVYEIPASQINQEELSLLNTVAMVSLDASNKQSLGEQIYSLMDSIPEPNKLVITNNLYSLDLQLPKDIEFYNSYGGFVNQGREYLINKLDTPTPWVNVIANDSFGFIQSNNMGGFTYAHNSREFKLTSWSNDMVGNYASEVIMINNHKFKPSLTKHGFGYTIFYSITSDYDISLKVFIGLNDKIKFYELNVTNKLDRLQTIRFSILLEMVLGVTNELTHRYLTSYFDKDKNCLYIKNNYNSHFKKTSVFLTSTEPITSFNDDDNVMKSITVDIEFKANESKTFSFMLGCEQDDDILTKYRSEAIIKQEYTFVNDYWHNLLSVITVDTPDKAFNYVLNGWYLYQTYASRLLARAGFYQAGGAFGFRDQLQDTMAIIYSDQNRARDQILRHAKHQFKEGDVLHWWHEGLMIGSRTKFSDDYLWLVYVTNEYLKITNDYSILDEKVCFVEGEKLMDYESEKGVKYVYSSHQETLYNHLKLCITKSLSRFGKHGLPLMGSGDWNDGMNRVGHKGRGESIFVGFFLYDILPKMANISKAYNDNVFAKFCLERWDNLGKSLTKNTWDGSWYLRAYFDNGDSLGSRNNQECKIDLLSQAWSVLCGFAPNDKKALLYKEIGQRLVDNDHKIIKLLTPAFNESDNNPGYIQDYPIGIRENGGQYTHAALWYIMALLKDNKVDEAYKYYQMINPINRSLTHKDVTTYQVEPYVIAADIYSHPNHIG